MQEDSSAGFVGQVLGRKSPVVDFRAAARLNPALPTPLPSKAADRASRASLDNWLIADDDVEAQRDSLQSEVRLSLRPSRLPVISAAQRHTGIDFAAIPVTGTWRFASNAMRFTLAVATGLALVALVTFGAKTFGPSMFAAYLAETPTVKSLRAEMRLDGTAKDNVLASAASLEEMQAGASLAAAVPAPHGKGAKASKAKSSAAAAKTAAAAHTAHHATSATSATKSKGKAAPKPAKKAAKAHA